MGFEAKAIAGSEVRNVVILEQIIRDKKTGPTLQTIQTLQGN